MSGQKSADAVLKKKEGLWWERLVKTVNGRSNSQVDEDSAGVGHWTLSVTNCPRSKA